MDKILYLSFTFRIVAMFCLGLVVAGLTRERFNIVHWAALVVGIICLVLSFYGQFKKEENA